MTVVLIHGVPETPAVWDRLAPLLDQPSIRLALPGFGNRRPEGFGSTMDEYLAWMADEIAAVEGPVDVVGHDWGGILVGRLVTTSPGAVRSWVSDAIGALSPQFTWHDFAKIWQTPGEGEAFWEGWRADPAGSAATLQALGVTEQQAKEFAAALDEEMSDSILRLYRSAIDIPGTWGAGARPTDPGLVIAGASDPFASADGARRVAADLGVESVVLEGGGHWWPLDAPEPAAEVLNRFWAGLDQ